MIPLTDHNPTRRFPVVTVLIIAACVYVYFFVQPLGQAGGNIVTTSHDDTVFTLSHAAIPCELVHGRPLDSHEVRALAEGDNTTCDARATTPPVFPHKDVWLSVLWSMFLHANLLHIAGNMLFLWIFGNNIEDRAGPVLYALFYLAAGVVATATFVLLQPTSTVPLIGASGAIAGVMGAYLVLFPRMKVRTLVFIPPFFVFWPNITAFWFLLFWFVEQFFVSPSQGVAWTAHVGGFLFGIVVALIWRSVHPDVVQPPAYRPAWGGPPRWSV